jgi:hypothetical protein
MSVYYCEMCDTYCDDDENPCHEGLTKFGLICDGCAIEHGCSVCDEWDNTLQYCKMTDQYYHSRCVP